MAVSVSLIILCAVFCLFLREAHGANLHLEELVGAAHISEAYVYEGQALGPLRLVEHCGGRPVVGPHLQGRRRVRSCSGAEGSSRKGKGGKCRGTDISNGVQGIGIPVPNGIRDSI